MDVLIDPRILGITAALASSASWALGSILFKRLGETLSPLAMTLAKGTVSNIYETFARQVDGFIKEYRHALEALAK